MTSQQLAALRAILDAITEAIAAAGQQGAPAGVLYSALMSYGITLTQFQSLTGGLIRAGKIRQEGQLFFVV